MNILLPLSGCALLSVLCPDRALAQSTTPDSSLLATTRTLLEQRYAATVQDQSILYNGGEYFNYTRYYQQVEGNQFFGSAQEEIGAIYYDGHYYGQVPLLYDIHLDQVITKQPTNSFTLRLISNRVKYFSLHGHTFTYILKDSAANRNIATGFYDVLLAGKVKVLARRTKKMQTDPGQNTTKAVFSAANQYFIQLGNTFYPVKSKGSVVSLFPSHRRELQKYAHDQHLLFTKESREEDIVAMARYYTSLEAS